MRQLLCCLALFAALLGGAHAQTPDAAKRPISIPANLVKECSELIAKQLPRGKIVGKFFPAKRRRFGSLGDLIEADEAVALVAPIASTKLFGGTYRGYMGCSYAVENGALSFRKLLSITLFPSRYKLEPGEQ